MTRSVRWCISTSTIVTTGTAIAFMWLRRNPRIIQPRLTDVHVDQYNDPRFH